MKYKTIEIQFMTGIMFSGVGSLTGLTDRQKSLEITNETARGVFVLNKTTNQLLLIPWSSIKYCIVKEID